MKTFNRQLIKQNHSISNTYRWVRGQLQCRLDTGIKLFFQGKAILQQGEKEGLASILFFSLHK